LHRQGAWFDALAEFNLKPFLSKAIKKGRHFGAPFSLHGVVCRQLTRISLVARVTSANHVDAEALAFGVETQAGVVVAPLLTLECVASGGEGRT
jgi:hypothetical protein